jgi:hypothetical protein
LLSAITAIALGLNSLVLLDWTFIKTLPSHVLDKQAFHPQPFVPTPHGLESQDDHRSDFWTWNTRTQFKTKESVSWKDGVIDKCALFPVHLLSKVQVVLKTGAADEKLRTDAELSTIIKCVPNVSDGNHTYGPDHRTVDVLADLPPNMYMKTEDYIVYEMQRNAIREDTELQQGHEAWRMDKYKFLPEVKKAIHHNNMAMWYVFIESDTYIFWDNIFRLQENYDGSLPYFFGSPSPGKMNYPRSNPKIKNMSDLHTEAPALYFLRSLRTGLLIDRATASVLRVLDSLSNT